MSKFHINKHGVPAPCRANAGNCPLGGEEFHFKTAEEAQEHADRQNSKKYGLVPSMERSENSLKVEEEINKGNIDKIERDLYMYTSADLESAYEKVNGFRDENGSLKVKYDETLEKRKEIHLKKQEVISKTKEEMLKEPEIKAEIEALKGNIKKINDKLEKQAQEEKENREGVCPKCGSKLAMRKGRYGDFLGCTNYPECKFTKKVKATNGKLKKELNEQKNLEEHKLEYGLDKKAEERAEGKKEYKKLKEQESEINRDSRILSHAMRYEKREYKFVTDSNKTKLEEYYERRKTADDKIEEKYGSGVKKSWGSENMKYGFNEVKEKLTTDENGNINNLYFEKNPGELSKVVKISEDGKMEFENGESHLITYTTNWRMDRGRGPSAGLNFFKDENTSGNEYKGPNRIQILNRDSSD